MSDSGEINKASELENSDKDTLPASKVDNEAAVKSNRYKATYPVVIIPSVLISVALVLLTYGLDIERISFGVIPAIVLATIGHFVWWLFWRKRKGQLEYHNKLSLIFIGFIAGA